MASRCGPAKAPFTDDLSTEESFFKALADPHRLRILATIARSSGEVCVCDLTEALPLLQRTVSHHFKEIHTTESETQQSPFKFKNAPIYGWLDANSGLGKYRFGVALHVVRC